MSATVDKRPHISMHIVKNKRGVGHIVITERPWRSRYFTLVCFCKRRRKDGTCQTVDPLLLLLRHPERGWVTHPEIDETRFRVPTPAEDGGSHRKETEQSAP